MGQKIISLPQYQEMLLVFSDRTHAGEVLAGMLEDKVDDNSILLAIPAGGVPVAKAVSEKLGLESDVLVVSKITLPWNTEAGYGAIAFDGSMRLNEMLLARLNLSGSQIQEGIAKTRDKVNRRARELRGNKPFPGLEDKTVIIIDDGLASGFTMFCAIDAVKKAGAQKIIVAVPTARQLKQSQKW